ncbi:MAG TPA: sensor histidine kinase [Vicinamibacterales bacterium]|nr:sensor histidine kinase [Vicinamibacterales bacterium]
MTASAESREDEIARLHAAIQNIREDRQRAECMASIQSDAVQLALDLLVTHPDLRGFFRMFIKRLVEDSESYACGVWLRDEAAGTCDLWMANIRGETYTSDSPGWGTLDLPREAMSRHLASTAEALTEMLQFGGDDERLPEEVRAFHRASGVESLLVAPLRLAPRTLGWIALSSAGDSDCERGWRRALLDATARQATLALYYSRVVEQSLLEARRQAVLEERNRIARDIHDTLAQGFGAILMQLQAAQRAAAGSLPPAATRSLETAIDLARTHLVEARRSVAALRPSAPSGAAGPASHREDLPTALRRMVDMAERTADVPIELVIDELPEFEAGVEREIIGIAQEALTNAARHAQARRIKVHAGGVRGVGFRLSIADDGRGISGDRASAGFGMTSMRERADRIGASLTFVTAARSGTEVVLAWQPAAFSIPQAVNADR